MRTQLTTGHQPDESTGDGKSAHGLLDQLVSDLSWILVLGAVSVGVAGFVRGGPKTGLAIWLLALAALALQRFQRRRTKPRKEVGGRKGFVLACVPILIPGTVLLLADRMSRAFRLDIDPNYYHLSIINAFVSGTSFGDSIYPRISFSFRPDAYPLSGHGMAAELVVLTGGIGGLLVLGVASVLLLMLAAVSIATFAVSSAGEGSVPGRVVIVGLLAGMFVGLPTVVYLSAGMPSDMLACAALAALIAVTLSNEGHITLAAGLAGASVGSKTTTLIPVIIVVAYLAVRDRRSFAIGPTLLAIATFVLAGGHWFIRDLIHHGSPFWPQLAVPWGDPKPIFFSDSARFIEHPMNTLMSAARRDLANFGPGVPLTLAAAIVGSLSVPRRPRYGIWAALMVAVLAWACSLQTGIAPGNDDTRIAFGAASRYFAPVQILASAIVCGLIHLGSRRARTLGAISGALNLAGLAFLISFQGWGLIVVVALFILTLWAVAVPPDLRATRDLRLASTVAVGLFAIPLVAIAGSPQRLWRQAIDNSFTPFVKERRACLRDLTCLARDGDRLNALDSPGFKLGPYLNQRVSVVPGTRT